MTNLRVALSVIDWPYSVTALWGCRVGQKGEGLVRALLWLLFLAHTLTPAFQKLSHPRYLVDQHDFYLHVKLHLCGLEIPAFRVATTSGHDWKFPQADILFLHSPACPSPLLPECHANLGQKLPPTLGLWRRDFISSLQAQLTWRMEV